MSRRRLPVVCHCVVITALAVCADVALAQSMLYVDDSATGVADGSSWCDGFVFLQDALATADARNHDADPTNDVIEIHVAQGTYQPDRDSANPEGARDRTATFQLLSDIALRGGYAGCGAIDPDARDITDYETILSGDLNEDDDEPIDRIESNCCSVHPSPGCDDATCEADRCAQSSFCCSSSWSSTCARRAVSSCCEVCSDKNNCENSYHVLTSPADGDMVVLEGFTITAGNANGGGAFNHNFGGGLFSQGGLTITDCTFKNNFAFSFAGMSGVSNSVLLRCSFVENWAAILGGGLSARVGGMHLQECEFLRNEAQTGGAIMVFEGTIDILDSVFIGNRSSSQGGAINNQGDMTVSNCLIEGNFSGRSAGAFLIIGGGSLTLLDSTVVDNVAVEFGGAISTVGSATTLIGSVLWGNEELLGAENPTHISVSSGGTVRADYSDIEGLSGSLGGIGNVGQNPMFVDPGYWDDVGTPDDPGDDVWVSGDYRLLTGSPVINVGNPAFVVEEGDTDLASDPRLQGCRIDMGAYESNGEQDLGDFNSNGRIDLDDFGAYQLCFRPDLTNPEWVDACVCVFDFNFSNNVDLGDLALFNDAVTGP